MKHVKRFLALSLAAALLAGCVSCGNSDEKTSPTGGGSGVDSTGDGGTLRIAMTCAALPNTDSEPTEGQEGYRFVSFQLYDALVKWDASSETEAGKIIPGLATSCEQNPENPKRWTFHLREGVKFHDGTDFNADCVIFALDRVMNPDFEYYSTTCAASVGSFLANIESYAKVDDYTITIDTVQDNNAYLIYDLPYIMIPSMEAVKEKGDGFADAPVGSGPFRFVSKIAGQELVMERNENYWGNVPQIKTLILKPISDASARLAALQSGEVDWAEVVPVESLESLKSQGYQVKLNDYMQYFMWLGNAVRGNFGNSVSDNRLVLSVVSEALHNTLILALGASIFAFLLSILIGVYSSYRPNSIFSWIGTVFGIGGISIPNYCLSLILIGIFSVNLRLLPSTGMYTSGDYTFSSLIQHLILPAIAAGAMTLGIMTRMVRSSVSEMRSRSFVTTLRAKGLSEPAIMRHVLRNSFPTLLTVAGLQFGYLMGGSTMVETIFSWPGIGLIIYQSIFTSDFPVTQAAILIVAAIFVSINLLIDLLRIVADPRLRK